MISRDCELLVVVLQDPESGLHLKYVRNNRTQKVLPCWGARVETCPSNRS